MKEINILDNTKLKIKLLILENSISFIEEYFEENKEQQKSRIDHYNVPIADIQRIKYSSSAEVVKSKANYTAFLFAGLFLIATIVFVILKMWGAAGVCGAGALIALVVGFILATPEQTDTSQRLIIEGENDKKLYSKSILLSTEKLLEIITSIRELQNK